MTLWPCRGERQPCHHTANQAEAFKGGLDRTGTSTWNRQPVLSVPSAISSLLASVTLDLSQYALDIVKGLASEYTAELCSPRGSSRFLLY